MLHVPTTPVFVVFTAFFGYRRTCRRALALREVARGIFLTIRCIGSGVLLGTRIADSRGGDGKFMADQMMRKAGQRGMASGRWGEETPPGLGREPRATRLKVARIRPSWRRGNAPVHPEAWNWLQTPRVANGE